MSPAPLRNPEYCGAFVEFEKTQRLAVALSGIATPTLFVSGSRPRDWQSGRAQVARKLRRPARRFFCTKESLDCP